MALSADWSTAVSSRVVYIPPTLSHFSIRGGGKQGTNMQVRFSSKLKERDGGRERMRERAAAGACVEGVTLVNNLQLGCTFPKLQSMKTAGSVQPNCQSLLCCP